MKLLIFIHSLGAGGAERSAVNIANYWAHEGRAVTLVTMAAGEPFYELHPTVRHIAMDLARESSNRLAALMNNMRRLLALRGVLRGEAPAVALGMMSTGNVLLSLASIGLGIPTIGAERAHPNAVKLRAIWSWLRRIAYRRLDALVVLTPEAATWIRERTGASRVAVIPNAVVWPLPTRQPSVNPASVGTPGKNRLLAVARLAGVKGIDSLISAFAQVAPRQPNWELVIIGDGPEREKLQTQVRAHGLENQVVFVGQVGDLGDWYRSAQLFVLTSRHEGFPNVLLEAMAHGLPCVSFDCEAGPRNIIRHGVDGLLVADQDINALASALESLMNDEAMRACYGERATEVRERFAATRVFGMWEELIRETLSRHGGIKIGEGLSPRL